MGNCNDKPQRKAEPDQFFRREKWKEDKVQEVSKMKVNPNNRRVATKEPAIVSIPGAPDRPQTMQSSVPKPTRSYDDEAIERMRVQLNSDSNAFLLNNILLSVQFFENFEKEIYNIKNNPMSDREHRIDEAMVRHHKHVFFADRLQECVYEHVRYARRKDKKSTEALSSPRMFVIYDNIEASDPGDVSDYSTVLDAPFYKLLIEDCKEAGYTILKKMEVLESTVTNKEIHKIPDQSFLMPSEDSVYTESEKESNDSGDDSAYPIRGEDLLHKIKSRLMDQQSSEMLNKSDKKVPINKVEVTERRRSGPLKQFSAMAAKGNISNLTSLRNKASMSVMEEEEERRQSVVVTDKSEPDSKIKKSILKNSNTNVRNGPVQKENTLGEDTETSGYRSNSSRTNESSEAESDYGYATIRAAATPKRVELSLQSNLPVSSGVLPDECWSIVKVKAIHELSDDDDDVNDDEDDNRKESLPKNLYDTYVYLNSVNFMTNFVDNFMIKLGSALGFTKESVGNSLTQGATVYCDSAKSGTRIAYEIVPAMIAGWPNTANQWIIRERKVIVNPRTNLNYQWPTKYMVSKVVNFGCLLIPIGYRPKRGINPNQNIQWRVIFPAAERYLESSLGHSHIRCYLFALVLHKTFMEIETSKVGIDASHIKTHLFWECEDNLAKWPEDRLGETLRLFLLRFYEHFSRAKLPNYFVELCNDFKGIPMPILLKLQRRLHDILQSPVMHLLSALQKLKYTTKEFYPPPNINKLYLILTCKNPLRFVNPNLPQFVKSNTSSDSESDDEHKTIWERAKSQDKHYQWKVARRQAQERRKAMFNKKVKVVTSEKSIDKNFMIPPKMEVERRRLVLEFFIPHFIEMARCSEKYEAFKQAIIYLQQAHRLSVLLQEQPGGDNTASEYMEVINDGLAECHRKIVTQSGYKISNRRESSIKDMKRGIDVRPRQRPKFLNIVNQDSPTETPSAPEFIVADVHSQPSTSKLASVKQIDSDDESEEESRL